MPRNGSGTSSVVNSFTPFTVADANDVNENFDDVADQLTNSLPRDGQAGMTGQLKADDGTVSLPGITFTNDLDTGVRRIGANKLAIVTAGADKMTFDANGPIASLLKGHIWGLTLSNNVADATNDIDIAVGQAASDSTIPELMTLGTAITKRLDANWAVGNNQGGLDTGSIADTTYHVWLIQRSDTGVVDALFSASATSPTMPTNYDRKRRIGSFVRASAAIRLFDQVGDIFTYRASLAARNSTSATAATLVACPVPSGIVVFPILVSKLIVNVSSTVSNGLGSAAAGSTIDTVQQVTATASAVNVDYANIAPIYATDTSRQIYFSCTISSGSISSNILSVLGYIDLRGKNG